MRCRTRTSCPTFIFAVSLLAVAAGCNGQNFLNDTLTGSKTCESAVKRLAACCQETYQSGTIGFEVCNQIDVSLFDNPNYYSTLVTRCQNQKLGFPAYGASPLLKAEDMPGMTCSDLLAAIDLTEPIDLDGDKTDADDQDTKDVFDNKNDESQDVPDSVDEASDNDSLEDAISDDELEQDDFDQTGDQELPEYEKIELEIVCDPLQKKCSDDGLSVEICLSDGTGWSTTVCKDANPCTQDRCEQGACVFDAAAKNGEECNDNNICTTSDSCSNGSCSGSSLDCVSWFITNYPQIHPDCVNLDQDIFCSPLQGCTYLEDARNGAVCETGDKCTDDRCVQGLCIAGDLTDCSAFNNGQCVKGTCNAETGLCAAVAQEGKSCSVADRCVDTPQCTASGECKGPRKTCIDGNACTLDGVCDSEFGCVYQPDPAMQNTACDDANACTENTVCQGVRCAGGQTIDCSKRLPAGSSSACLVSTPTCNTSYNPATDPPGGPCVFVFKNGGVCDDGDPCTLNTRCVAATGACSGALKDCSSVVTNATCGVGQCNISTGVCEVAAINEGSSCDDGNQCTQGDACQGGICSPGSMTLTCADGYLCTDDSCNPYIAAPADPCVHRLISCDDSNSCTTDACREPDAGNPDPDKQTDRWCDNQPRVGSSCDDGLFCNGREEECNNEGRCVATLPAPNCQEVASDACHVGVCDERTSGCVEEEADDGTVCDDGLSSTVSDYCLGGHCVAGDTLPLTIADDGVTQAYRVVDCPTDFVISAAVEVNLEVSHPRGGDLTVHLVSPGGFARIIYNRAVAEGVFTIAYTEPAFIGHRAGGAWTLRIHDAVEGPDPGSDTPQLRSFSLTTPCDAPTLGAAAGRSEEVLTDGDADTAAQ